MSCFEQSVFLQNATQMDQTLLIQACEQMNWKTKQFGQELWIIPADTNTHQFRNEPIIKLRGNKVTWNSYYMKDGRQKVEALRESYQEIYHEMRVKYALEAIKTAFKKIGFSYLEDLNFQANSAEKHRFYMKGRSKTKEETEPIAKIKFTILHDGTVRSSSDYIPEDIHILADQAMEVLEAAFGCTRTITPKEIPAKYIGKTFCHNKNVIQIKQGKK